MNDSAIESDGSQICPYCGSAIRDSDEIAKCSKCLSTHHLKCWEHNNGCTTFGCRGSALSAVRADESPQPPTDEVGRFFALVTDGNVEGAEQMLNAFSGADLHNAWSGIAQPLHVAVGRGHLALAELLIERGSDINTQDKAKGWTPVRVATITNQKDMVAFLLSKSADGNVVALDGTAPLHEAAAKGTVGIARLLLDAGADVDAKSKIDETPLHFAAKNGSREMVELLVAKGANVNAIQRTVQYTPLHIAAVNGHLEAAEALLRAGADPNARAMRAATPLHEAAFKGNQEMVNLLTKYGSSANMRTTDGLTPGQLAVRNKQQAGCATLAVSLGMLAIALVVITR